MELPKEICMTCATSLQYWETFTLKARRVNGLLRYIENLGREFTEQSIAWIKQKIHLEFHAHNDEGTLTESVSLGSRLVPSVCIKLNDCNFEATEVSSNLAAIKHKSGIITNNSFITFQCHLCKDTFQNWCALGNHTARRHEQKPKVLCLCNQFLYTRAAINRHISKHDSSSHISCPKCGKVCLSQKYLQAHVLSHNSDEGALHSCDQCGRSFTHSGYLKAHKRTHLLEHEKRMFTCSICNKKLSTKSSWKNHIASVHHKKKPFICDICGHKFAHKTNMVYHLRSHGEIFAFPCSDCPKRFKNKGKLDRHKKTHSSQVYPCSVCAKVLRSRNTLRAHTLTHSGGQSFTCHICHKTYKKKVSLKVYDYFDKCTFICDWYEEDADQIRELCLHFFPYDNSVQVIDVGREKKFVSRVVCPELFVDMLQIGATIRLFSRLLYIKSCAAATRRKLFNNFQNTFALIKPMPASAYGKIFTFILKNGFRILRLKKAKADKDFILLMNRKMANDPNLPIVVDYETSDEVIGMELVAADCIKKWRNAIGYRDPARAEPGTLRRMYGEGIVKNIVHGADDPEDVKDCLDYFFGASNKVMKIPIKAVFKNCTCCIIKPHAIVDGNMGNILTMITAAKFKISAMAMFSVNTVNAEEFHEVYKGVIAEFTGMAAQLSQGQCVALEILGDDPGKSCVCEFRKLCGPRDPDVCRQLYPDSIRAHYGRDIVHNAVHCTDLPEDGVQEVEYFFKILAQTSF